MDQELAGPRQAIGFEKLTVAGTAVGFTPANYKNVAAGSAQLDATSALVTADGTAGTNDVRWRCDGTDPVAGTGHLLAGGKVLMLKGYGNITKFRAIREGGTSGTLEVTFFS
jgi:hypothetical protein